MMKQVRFLPRLARLLVAALGAIVLTACGGGGSGGGSGSSSFAIGGKLSGLAAGQQVTLLDNGGDALTLSADGTFEFSSKVAANASYLVSVGTQPAGQVCTVGGGSGAGVTADVSSIQVVCSTQSFGIAGSLSGLGAGQSVTLLNNGSDPLTLTGNGAFSFATPVAYNGSYAVTVGTQPTGQTCTVSGGSGAGVTANVGSVSVVCSADTYTVGGTLIGLAAGQQLTLMNNGADPLTVTANGNFTFATPVAYNGSYAVTVGTQPTGQTCTVSSASGAGVTANVGGVSVVCSTNTFTIGGSVNGLAAGQQLTLLDNGGDALTLTASGNFAFATSVAFNGSYAVTVSTQPTGQTCTVGSGSGSGVSANVSNVSVVCSATTFTVGGTLSGLAAGQQVTLLDNGGDALTLTGGGNFSFATPIAFNGSYAVTVSTQPTGQTCTVGNASGAGMTANVSNVNVVCSANTYTVGGSLSGLASGQQITLLDNGGDALTLTADGNFTFATSVAYNGSYAVTVGTQPTGQTCTVSSGSGAGMTADVSSVSVTCSTNTYTIGGNLSGLATGQQVTLMNNAGDPLTLTGDGNFTFATPVAYNGSYAVTVGTQPTGQTCTVGSGSGSGVTANVGGISVVCSTNTFTIGGSLSGLAAGQQVTLMNNGADPLTLTANGNFTFATSVAYGGSYAVTVGTQPVGQTCTVSSGSGSSVGANVGSVAVSCSTNTYTIGGTLSGLAAGQQITLLDNGGDALTLTADGNFSFATSVAYGSSYAVTIGTQPTGQTCTVASGSGSSVNANVSSVAVSCTTNTYTIGGTLTGLAAGQQVILLDNGGDALTASVDGNFNFATSVAYGGSYAVTVGTQPAGQTCTVSSGSGSSVSANVSSVTVSCTTNTYTIGGTLTGLAAGQQITLLNSGGDALTLSADGNFSFATSVAYGGSYAVTIGTQPTGQTCTVASGSGSSVNANVSSVAVSCTTNTYTIGGTLTGLAAGQQITLLDNGGDALTLTADANFSFATSVAYGGSYAVTVGTQPTGQTCTVSSGSGSSVNANVSSVTVSCTTNTYTIGGTLTGLAAGQQITLLNSGGDALTLSADGNFSFATSVAYGGSYAVTVGTQPTGQTCTVSSGSGSSVNANVSSVAVSCTTNTYTIGGTLTGLAAGQQIILLDNGGDALTLTADGNFSFATSVAYGGSYAVTIGTQPTGQTCTVASGSGSSVNATVSSVAVSCTTNTYTIGGTLTGLAAGQQITLLNSGGDALTLSADGNFSFATSVAYGGSYAVTVGTQPTGQTCTVSSGSGSSVNANVSSVAVSCTTNTYTIGGTLTGLAAGQQITLLDNGGDALTLTADGNFNFATSVPYGGSYAVTVGTQPTGQSCTVASGSGSSISANVSSVAVSCTTNSYTIGGTLTGLAAGQQITLLDNGGDPLTLTANASFSFATLVAYGGSYAVTIGTPPAGQSCTVSSGSGSGVSANVASVSVTCVSYTVGGTLSGLAAGQQVTLLDNGGDALTLNANGGFTFPSSIAAGASYLVSVGTQPTSETCTVNNGAGYHVTASATNVAVVCSSSGYTVSVTVSGLAAGQQFTLLDNASDGLVVTANGTASFASTVAQGASYVLTFQAQPTSQTCSISENSGVGTQATATVTKIVCSSSSATIGGTLSGLAAGEQLTLLNNSGDPLLLSANGGFTFPAKVALGASYTVVVGTQPSGHVCSVSNGAGYPVGANVNSVSVTCVAAMHAYVVNNVDATVSQYLIGGDGSLSPLTPATVSTAPAPTDMVVDSSGKYAYVIAQSSVSQYVINADGTLSPMTPSTVSVSGTPKSIAIDPQGRWVYVSTSASLIEQYTIGSGGTLTPMSPPSVSASSPWFGFVVDPTSRYAYLTGGTGEYQFSIGSGGLLSYLSPASVNVGGTLWGLAAEPTGHYVYVPIANSRGVQQLTIGSSGQLSVNGMITVGTGPDALAVDPTGRYLYVVNASDNTVSQLAIVPGGSLTSITPSAATATKPVHVAVDPTGRYLYVANATSSNVSQFSIGPGGVLSPLTTATVAAGASPSGIAIH